MGEWIEKYIKCLESDEYKTEYTEHWIEIVKREYEQNPKISIKDFKWKLFDILWNNEECDLRQKYFDNEWLEDASCVESCFLDYLEYV